jgi:cysteine-rich repeat protein
MSKNLVFAPFSCVLGLCLSACFSPNVPAGGDGGDEGSDGTHGTSAGSGNSNTGSTASTGPSGTSADGTGMTDPTTVGTVGTDGSGTDAESGTDPSGSSSDGGGPLCGNGQPDPGEACDDGDRVNGNGCNNDCVESGTLLWEVDPGEGYAIETDSFHYFRERVAVDANGDSVVALSISGNADDADVLVRRIDEGGGVVWSDQWTSVGQSLGVVDIALDSLGSAWIVGGQLPNVFTFDGILRQYSVAGFVSWTTGLDLASDNVVRAVDVGADDEAFLAWQYLNTPDELILERRTAAGDVALTDSTVDPDSDSYPLTISVADDGGFVLCEGDTGSAITRYTSNAVLDWTISIAGLDLWGCDADDAGRIAVVGDIGGSSWVGSLDADGAELWSAQYRGVGAAALNGVTLDHAGNTIAVGMLTEDGNAKRWLRKFDPDGALLWELVLDFSDGAPEFAMEAGVDEEDNVYVVGRKDDVGTRRAWLAKFAP